jgi:hypothetical protein
MEGISILAFSAWAGLPLVLLAFIPWRRKRPVPPAEFALATAFNGLIALILAFYVLPGMRPDLTLATRCLLSFPFLLYGLLGFAIIRSRIAGGRSAKRWALEIYGFSFAGHLLGMVLLLGYLTALQLLK